MAMNKLDERELREQVTKIDNVIEKRISDRLNETSQVRVYGKPRTLVDVNSTASQITKALDEYTEVLTPWKNGDSWNDAESAAIAAALKEAIDEGRTGLWNRTHDKAMGVANNLVGGTKYGMAIPGTETVKEYLVDGACWEVVKDLPGFDSNPYDSMLLLVKEGLKPTYFRKIHGEERFVVDIPLARHKNEFGCWVYGDERLIWKHSCFEDCRYLALINPHVRVIE